MTPCCFFRSFFFEAIIARKRGLPVTGWRKPANRSPERAPVVIVSESVGTHSGQRGSLAVPDAASRRAIQGKPVFGDEMRDRDSEKADGATTRLVMAMPLG